MNDSIHAMNKKRCITCEKNAGILICDGCEQAFCGKHGIEHREKLAIELDEMMQEYDLLQYQMNGIGFNHSLEENIDRWEEEASAMIRMTAEMARKKLRKILEQSKERVLKKSQDMANDLRSAREADDYSEKDFRRWKEQFQTIQLDMTAPILTQIIKDEKSVIHLIQIDDKHSITTESTEKKNQLSITTNSTKFKMQEKFFEVMGPILLENEGSLALHTGPMWTDGYILGNGLYSHDQHSIRFKIEHCQLPYYIFFGCTSSKTTLAADIYKSLTTVGWFGSSQVYEHGRCSTNSKKYNYNSYSFGMNDVLCLTLDCKKKSIHLYNERLKKSSTLKVDITKTPYPWRLLVVILNAKDRVRILPDI